jgi:hypothetical protein
MHARGETVDVTEMRVRQISERLKPPDPDCRFSCCPAVAVRLHEGAGLHVLLWIRCTPAGADTCSCQVQAKAEAEESVKTRQRRQQPARCTRLT